MENGNERSRKRMSSNKVTSDTRANECQFVKMGYIYMQRLKSNDNESVA